MNTQCSDTAKYQYSSSRQANSKQIDHFAVQNEDDDDDMPELIMEYVNLFLI